MSERNRECHRDIVSVREILGVSERYSKCQRDIGSVRKILGVLKCEKSIIRSNIRNS